MTRSLLISLLLLTGCASVQPTSTADVSCIRKFIPDFKSQWYRSTIDVRGRHLSGLVLFKMMPDSTMRIVFTNEAGVKFFDYQFDRNGNFKVIESIKPLRRKIVSNLLRKDLEVVTMMKVRTEAGIVSGNSYSFGTNKELNRFTVNNDCSQLINIERLDGDNIKATAKFFGDHTHVPDSIFLSHLDFAMEMKFRHLKKD